MHRLTVALLAALLALPALAADEPKTEEQKTLYAIGLGMAKSADVFGLTKAEYEWVKRGLADAASGKKTAVEFEAYQQKISDLAKARSTAKGKEALEKYAKEKGAVKTESGLIYISQKEGTGPQPAPTDTVKVHYRGTLPDGKEFDSSYKRNAPTEFPLNGVIKCWTEGVAKMKAGGKAKLVCPPGIAYGERGAGAVIPPNATLIFEVELLEVVKKEAEKKK